MTRTEWLDHAKRRAREYLDNDYPFLAVMSMVSDLKNHPETRADADNPAVALLMAAAVRSVDEARQFIEGLR